MIKEAVATGENVEVAFANACKALGVEITGHYRITGE